MNQKGEPAPASYGRLPVPSSSVLQYDPLERIADVFAAVDRVLDVVVQLFPLDHVQRLDAAGEQPAQGGMVVVVADALLVVDLDQLVTEFRELAALAQPV